MPLQSKNMLNKKVCQQNLFYKPFLYYILQTPLNFSQIYFIRSQNIEISAQQAYYITHKTYLTSHPRILPLEIFRPSELTTPIS